METEFYILKIRLLSALRWFRELGFIRIIISVVLIAAVFKSLWNISDSLNGIIAIILLNAGIIYSIHFSRKDEFFLDSLDISKKFLFAMEYFLCSLPFLALLFVSKYYYSPAIVFILIGIIITIKSGRNLKLNLSSVKSVFPLYGFEWISGIRVNFFPVLIIYVMGLALSYQLAGGILAIILLTFLFSSFFIENEPLSFIEAYKLNEKKFLRTKILQASKIYLLIILPLAIMHLIFFYERWYLVTGLIFLCLIIIISAILTKYAFYSEEIATSKMNYIINGIIIFSFVSTFFMTGPLLFPLPFFMMAYLYLKAVKNIKNARFIDF